MDADPESFLTAARVHALHGTTALCPTTLSGEFDETMRVFSAYEEAKKHSEGGARFIGLHLEGPYFAMSQKGAQDPKYIRPPEPSEYGRFLDACGDIVRWSAAPELPGAMAFGRDLAGRGILPSIAHTDADFDTAAEALANGYTHVTHLYSCMPGVHRVNAYRVAGAVEAALYYDGFTVEIIADGCHLPAALLKLVYKCKRGADRAGDGFDARRGYAGGREHSRQQDARDGGLDPRRRGMASVRRRVRRQCGDDGQTGAQHGDAGGRTPLRSGENGVGDSGRDHRTAEKGDPRPRHGRGHGDP